MPHIFTRCRLLSQEAQPAFAFFFFFNEEPGFFNAAEAGKIQALSIKESAHVRQDESKMQLGAIQ